MTDFRIRRGLYAELFPSPGEVNPRLAIEEGCWYLCVDTAELFLGATDDDGKLTLKRINEIDSNKLNSPSFGPVGGELEEDALFVKIFSESDLPTEFEAEDFDPNITYYVPIVSPDGEETGKVSTYIFDRDTQSYICTNSIDEVLIRAMVADAVGAILDDTVAEKLPGIVDNRIEELIKDTFEYTILYGGDATPED